MSDAITDHDLVEVAKEYFRRMDAGREDVVDLFTEDVQIYFPKFGVASGKTAIFDLAARLLATLNEISHDVDRLTCVVQGDMVVTEGMTRGVTKSGVAWAGGETPGGRFCNVFHFRDGRIDRVHIYLDPDYGGEDRNRFLWGTDRRW